MKLEYTIFSKSLYDYSITEYQDSSLNFLQSSLIPTTVTAESAYHNNIVQCFSFQSNNIEEYLIGNQGVVDYLQDLMDRLTTEGLIWYGDLQLLKRDEDKPKLLITYRPIVSNQSSVTLNDDNNLYYNNKGIYKRLILDLFKRNASVKNSIIVDEQVL